MTIADTPLRFVHISDTHINPDHNYIKEYAQYTPNVGVTALIEALHTLPFQPDFILHTGDVAYDPVPGIYLTVAAMLGKLEPPVYYLAGNHDDARELQTVVMGRSGDQVTDELYYTVDLDGAQLICLDSNGPHDPEKPSGGISDAQLTWLEETLAADDDRPLLVAVHHNVLPVHIPWIDDWMRIENGEALHAVLRGAGSRLQAVLYGHIHQNMTTIHDGIPYISAGSSWCSFNGYPTPQNTRLIYDRVTQPSFNIITLGKNGLNVRRQAFSVSQS